MAATPTPVPAHGATAGTPATDPLAVLRSRSYLVLLVVAGVLGVPIAAAAYWFLKLTTLTQQWAFTDAPKAVGFHGEPIWWPVVPLTIAGLLVGATIRYLPGGGGESPTRGFHAGGVALPITLPSVFLAAVLSIGLGVVIGPEAPLIALGGGLAYFLVRLVKRDLPPQTAAVIGATGSFAAIATLLGNPLAGALLLMEASAAGGLLATVVLLPGLLAAGVGALVFTGLDSLTGYGTFSLVIPNLPKAGTPTVAEFGWAIAVGLVAAPTCVAIKWLAVRILDWVQRRRLLATVLLGAVIAGLSIGYAEATSHGTSDVLFSGQSALPGLVSNSAGYTVGALVLLVGFKGLAYAASLSAFRGGPTFPALFLGAAGGMALSHLPGLSLVAGIAMGMSAMTAGMLRLPMTAVLVTTLFLGTDSFPVIPLTIVAVVVAFVASSWLSPPTPSIPQQASASSRT